MEVLDGDCEILFARVDRFIRDSASLVRTLVAASARSDAHAMAKALRELGRESAAIGAQRLRAMCVLFERSLTDERQLEAIGRELANVELELRELMNRTVPQFI